MSHTCNPSIQEANWEITSLKLALVYIMRQSVRTTKIQTNMSYFRPNMLGTPVILAFERQRQEDYYKLEASLMYTVSSTLAKVILQDLTQGEKEQPKNKKNHSVRLLF